MDGDIRTSAAELGPVMSGVGKQSGRAMVKVVAPDKESTFVVVKVKACLIGLPKYARLYTSISKHAKSVSRRSLQSGQSALRTVASTPSLIDLYLRISSPEPNAFWKEDLLVIGPTKKIPFFGSSRGTM